MGREVGEDMNEQTKLEDMLGKIFDGLREGVRAELPPEEYETRRHDFIFHMIDWKDDLKQVAGLFENPEIMDEDAAATLLVGFMYHALPHLNAAGKLLQDEIKDPFAGSEIAR